MRTSFLSWLLSIPAVSALSCRAVEERALDCNNGAIKIITSVLSYNGPVATRLCSDILKRGPGPTTTVVSVKTTTAFSGSTISTVRSGVTATTIDSTLSLRTGSTQTITNTRIVSTASTTTVTTSLTTSTVVTSAAASTSTTYVPVYVPPPNTAAVGAYKRDELEQRQVIKATPTSRRSAATTAANDNPESFGRRYPDAPKQLLSLAYSAVSKGCDCLLPVSTATVSSVSIFTSTVPATIVTTIPSSTVTVTNTITSISDIGSITTTFIDSTVTNIVPVTATSTSLTTTTKTATATTTATVTYNQQHQAVTCVYNAYYDLREVDNNPANSYIAGINQCSDRCSRDPGCKMFFFFKSDPNKARGFSGAYCFLDGQPYDPAFLQCSYVSSYSVAYNKGNIIVT